MTVKNKYSLPLISKLMSQLCGARYFTKLDVCWGFNNVCIKPGDEWKVAFQTNRGLFEPLVMFFGMTNSLATFQTIMNNIFRNLIVRATGHKTPGESSVILQSAVRIQLTSRRILRD